MSDLTADHPFFEKGEELGRALRAVVSAECELKRLQGLYENADNSPMGPSIHLCKDLTQAYRELLKKREWVYEVSQEMAQLDCFGEIRIGTNNDL